MTLVAQSIASLNSVVQCARLKLRDHITQDRLTGAFTSGGTTMAVSDGTNFSTGDVIDFPEDGTASVYFVRTVAANSLTVQVHMGSTDANHASGATIRKFPPHTRQEIEDAVSHAVDGLWPMVYDQTTSTITYSSTATHYAAPSDFMGGIWATQKGTETSNISYSEFSWNGNASDKYPITVKRGLRTTDFSSAVAFYIPSWYNTTNVIDYTYVRKVTTSTISTGLMASTVCWGAVAHLLGGDAAGYSKPMPGSPTSLNALRAGSNAFNQYEMGKSRLHTELRETYPKARIWRG